MNSSHKKLYCSISPFPAGFLQCQARKFYIIYCSGWCLVSNVERMTENVKTIIFGNPYLPLHKPSSSMHFLFLLIFNYYPLICPNLKTGRVHEHWTKTTCNLYHTLVSEAATKTMGKNVRHLSCFPPHFTFFHLLIL